MTAALFDGLTILRETIDARGWRARLGVEATSRAFEGHFEGEPILPGVAHLVIVRHALRAMRAGAGLRELPFVRFRRAVRPGDVLDVVVATPDGEGRCRFEVRVGGTVAATGEARTGIDG